MYNDSKYNENESSLGIVQVKRSIRTADSSIISNDNDWVVEEEAVALVYNGISHTVMMATPCDLFDFAVGFSLSENIISESAQILDYKINEVESGIEIDMQISSRLFSALKHKRRSLMGNSGCGLCGVESLAQVTHKREILSPAILLDKNIVLHAVNHFNDKQALNTKTGGAHAAAYCSITTGETLLIREDVGRHNALDKLIGAVAQLTNKNRESLSAGFILVSSRASYEMVDKTITAGIGHLVCMSAATSKAIHWASIHQLNLIGFARKGRHVVYSPV